LKGVHETKDMKKKILNFETLRKGDILTGKIESITQFGIFVKLPNSQIGLIHREDVSYIKGDYPIEEFIIGDTINVAVKSYDKNTGKLSLTYKDLLDPWNDKNIDFKEGDMILGVAKKHHENSIFVEVKPNVVGLANYKSGISYGDKVRVIVKKISPENKKIKLEIL
jgi:small subunit ribosomal protein S1